MVTFSVPAHSGAAPVSFRVRSHSVAFAGSRNGAIAAADAHALVEGFLHDGDLSVLRGQTYLDDGASVIVGETVEYLPSVPRSL